MNYECQACGELMPSQEELLRMPQYNRLHNCNGKMSTSTLRRIIREELKALLDEQKTRT
jgi:hypothetical protein